MLMHALWFYLYLTTVWTITNLFVWALLKTLMRQMVKQEQRTHNESSSALDVCESLFPPTLLITTYNRGQYPSLICILHVHSHLFI